MTTVLISGADGFIAQNTAAGLKAQGFRLIGISIEKNGLKYFDSVYEGHLTFPIKDVFQNEDIDLFVLKNIF